MKRASGRRGLVAALLVSLVLHALLLVWGRSRTPGPVSKVADSRAVEFDIVERQAPPIPPPVPPAPVQPAPPKRRPAPSQAQEPRGPPAQQAPSAAPPTGQRRPEERTSDFPIRAPSTSIDLNPRSLDSPLAPGPAPASPGSAAPPSAPEVNDMLRDGAAELQVRTGAMHVYYARLADALRAAWRARGIRARRKSGRPCTAEVRLVQAADGRVLQLSILFASCDPAMDEELLADLRIASLPPPPRELLAGRESLRTVYRFGFHPPPRVSLEFDIVDLVDPKAIPDYEPRRVDLVRPE